MIILGKRNFYKIYKKYFYEFFNEFEDLYSENKKLKKALKNRTIKEIKNNIENKSLFINILN